MIVVVVVVVVAAVAVVAVVVVAVVYHSTGPPASRLQRPQLLVREARDRLIDRFQDLRTHAL